MNRFKVTYLWLGQYMICVLEYIIFLVLKKTNNNTLLEMNGCFDALNCQRLEISMCFVERERCLLFTITCVIFYFLFLYCIFDSQSKCNRQIQIVLVHDTIFCWKFVRANFVHNFDQSVRSNEIEFVYEIFYMSSSKYSLSNGIAEHVT